jgi:hypothetical protein
MLKVFYKSEVFLKNKANPSAVLRTGFWTRIDVSSMLTSKYDNFSDFAAVKNKANSKPIR